MNTLQLPDLLTPDQAAQYLQVDRETIYRYIRDGRLGASRIGRGYRIPRQSIRHLLLATRTRPDVRIRSYSNEQIDAFMEADRLDGQALDLIGTLEIRESATSSGE